MVIFVLNGFQTDSFLQIYAYLICITICSMSIVKRKKRLFFLIRYKFLSNNAPLILILLNNTEFRSYIFLQYSINGVLLWSQFFCPLPSSYIHAIITKIASIYVSSWNFPFAYFRTIYFSNICSSNLTQSKAKFSSSLPSQMNNFQTFVTSLIYTPRCVCTQPSILHIVVNLIY